MKSPASVFLFLAVIIGLSAVPASADTYLSGSIGIGSVDNTTIKDSAYDGELSFDNGFSATSALGQTLGNAVRVEMELGYRTNDIDKISIDGVGTTSDPGDLTTISLMGNAYYDIQTGTGFTPFIGAGIGVANIEAEIVDLGAEDDNVFAYQIFAGGSLAISENLHIDLQYRYFGTEDPELDGLNAEYSSHNLMFGLRLDF